MAQITVTVQGVDRVKNALNNMASDAKSSLSSVLDTASGETKEKMRGEAPVGTGRLKDSIAVNKPDSFTREIEPTARNTSPSKNRYGKHVESGTGPRGGGSSYVPNIGSIMNYYGVDKRVAWAIALRIKERGTPSNPFVSRTFEWVKGKLRGWSNLLGKRVVARFV